MILGVGSGESLNEVAVTGMTWPSSKERLARLHEAVELIRRLWTEELVTFDGEYYHTRNATIYHRPDEPIPIYISAGGPVAPRLPGPHAHSFIPTPPKHDHPY